ncbi:MAG: hypothetical protein QM597_00950 [Aeromicrobium sp.]|uniref:SCO4848 family membrane protein n=1 Tax=Aeromicrobium sp. TaxID=1871063 RepID=UPI0039E4FDB6
MISQRAARLLVVAGLFNVFVWPRFAKAVVEDDRAWAGEHWASAPQPFFWVHAVLIVTAMTLGVIVVVVGAKAHRAARLSSPSD